MPKRKNRIVVDTNLWVSYLLARRSSRLDEFISSQTVLLLFSDELLDEFMDVVQRPKFRKYFQSDDLQSVLTSIRRHAEFISITSDIIECLDPKDNFLLALAKDGRADYLVTGDKDLLVMRKFGKTKIVTLSQFFSAEL